MPRPWLLPIFAGAAIALSACSAPDVATAQLGPKDGHDLTPADTGRVTVGDLAPDFSLESYRGDVVTLSEFRERKDVVLVFYRGHW
jgi:cytochrome oxidase Cu insertion factor (SCO1/SenC/PrrC family)